MTRLYVNQPFSASSPCPESDGGPPNQFESVPAPSSHFKADPFRFFQSHVNNPGSTPKSQVSTSITFFLLFMQIQN